ncbi:MAG: GIY-YIG nuclease family protein [Acidobacteriota bacterium]
MTTWHVYVVRTRRGALYTGIATDVERRVAEHEGDSKKGARSLRGQGPLELVYRVALADRAEASRVEALIKRQSKQRKERFVREQPCADTLRGLLDDA